MKTAVAFCENGPRATAFAQYLSDRGIKSTIDDGRFPAVKAACPQSAMNRHFADWQRAIRQTDAQ